jgi:hypothetical protein
MLTGVQAGKALLDSANLHRLEAYATLRRLARRAVSAERWSRMKDLAGTGTNITGPAPGCLCEAVDPLVFGKARF